MKKHNHEQKVPHWILAIGVFVFCLACITCTKRTKSIVIGGIMPLTGDAAVYGVAPRNGVQLAAEEVNASGGINGTPIQLVIEDSRCDAKIGVSAALKLITQDHVAAIIGPVCSSVALAVAPVANSNHVVALSPQASTPALTDAGPFVFRNWPSDVFEGRADADFAANQLKAHTAAVLYITNQYGMGVERVFEDRFKANGGVIIQSEGFDEGTTEFRTVLAKLKRLHPDVIYLASYLREASRILVQKQQLAITTNTVAPIGIMDAQLFALAGNAAEGLYVSAPIYDSNSDDSNVRRFVQGYKSKFGDSPNVYAATGYDALMILAKVMKERGSSPDAIRDGLHSVKNFPGVSGTTSFDSHGDVDKPVQVMIARGGQFVPFWKPPVQ